MNVEFSSFFRVSEEMINQLQPQCVRHFSMHSGESDGGALYDKRGTKFQEVRGGL